MQVSDLTIQEIDVLTGGKRQHERSVLEGMVERGLLAKVDPDAAGILGFEYGNTELGNKLLDELKSNL